MSDPMLRAYADLARVMILGSDAHIQIANQMARDWLACLSTISEMAEDKAADEFLAHYEVRCQRMMTILAEHNAEIQLWRGRHNEIQDLLRKRNEDENDQSNTTGKVLHSRGDRDDPQR